MEHIQNFPYLSSTQEKGCIPPTLAMESPVAWLNWLMCIVQNELYVHRHQQHAERINRERALEEAGHKAGDVPFDMVRFPRPQCSDASLTVVAPPAKNTGCGLRQRPDVFG